jgi:ribonuclease BN (tRNA processing enzyme)
VKILGSGGSAVSARRACPSILVENSTILDMGPGSLLNLRSTHMNLDELKRVFISHTHADHITDLIPFLWANQIDGREKPLSLYGPLGFKETLRRFLRCTSTPDDFFKFPLSVTELDFGATIGDVRTCGTLHSIPTMAFRIDSNGRSFCYSADTTYSPSVIELARNVDLLIHEATFLEDQLSIANLTHHSTAKMAGQAAREANAKRLTLFHIPPPNERREKEFYSDAKLTFGDDVVVAEDMAEFSF